MNAVNNNPVADRYYTWAKGILDLIYAPIDQAPSKRRIPRGSEAAGGMPFPLGSIGMGHVAAAMAVGASLPPPVNNPSFTVQLATIREIFEDVRSYADDFNNSFVETNWTLRNGTAEEDREGIILNGNPSPPCSLANAIVLPANHVAQIQITLIDGPSFAFTYGLFMGGSWNGSGEMTCVACMVSSAQTDIVRYVNDVPTTLASIAIGFAAGDILGFEYGEDFGTVYKNGAPILDNIGAVSPKNLGVDGLLKFTTDTKKVNKYRYTLM